MKQQVELSKLGGTLHAIITRASKEDKLRILKACNNSALHMERDAKMYYYEASGLKQPTGLLHGSYHGFMDAHAVGDTSFVRVGIKSAEALSKGYNYAIVHEYGFEGEVEVRAHTRTLKDGTIQNVSAHTRKMKLKARKIATSAVKHQGQVLINKLLKEIHLA